MAKRTIVPNDYDKAQWLKGPEPIYPTNMVKSSRFTWWNFFPIALAIQFTKLPNVFWLFNGCLQLVPAIRTNSPLSIFIPLAVVVAIGMLKEFIADNKRKKQDKKVNGTPCWRAKIGSKNRK